MPKQTPKNKKSCPSGVVKMTNQVEFDKVIKSEKPVVVQMYSNFCGACEEAKPLVEAAACELQGETDVYKVDVDANPKLADKFKVNEIPTVFVMQNGKIAKKTIGLNSSTELVKMVRAVKAGKKAVKRGKK